MTDKERLEEIKEDVENNCKKEYEFVTTILYEDAKLLISTIEEQQKEIEGRKQFESRMTQMNEVKIIKTKNDKPTVIEYQGQRFILQHPDHRGRRRHERKG